MTKLYLSGGIAGVPYFMERFAGWARVLEDAGYTVVNPTLTIACTEDSIGHEGEPAPCLAKGDPGTPGDPHSWNCYLRYDLREMLLCDGIAMMNGHETSRGAGLEMFIARQVGLEVGSVSYWLRKRPIPALSS